MSLEYKLSNETLAFYAKSSDALEALKLTVGNGQSRLALEVLLEITNQLCEKVNELEISINKLLMTKEKETVKENVSKKVSNTISTEEVESKLKV